MLKHGLLLLLTLTPVAAFAEGEDATPEAPRTVEAAVDGAFVPSFLPASTARDAAMVRAMGGYDSATEHGVFDSEARVRLFGPVTLRGGATYSPSTEKVRPRVGAAVQVLRQERHGIDGTVGVSYKAEGFTEAEGEIELELAAGRRFGRWTGVINLAYGQDPEAKERDGEIRLEAHARVAGRLHLGVATQARFDLGSDAGVEPESAGEVSLVAGPVAAYAFNSFAIFAQTGYSGLLLRDDTMKSGMVAMAGVGTAF